METTDSLLAGQEVLSQSEVERLLAQVAQQESSTVVHQSDGVRKKQSNDGIQPYDFRHPVFLSQVELRKLRVQHEQFIRALAARLSIYLRLEFGLQMSQLQTITYQKFTESVASPSHITLFKVEPLRGICILDVNPRLGLTIVDRQMGGPGHSVAAGRDLSDIEVALLDQALHLMISEWCSQWSEIEDIKPTILGHDNSARFLQTSARDAIVLVLTMEAQIGDCVESMQFAFPYNTIEPLIRQLSTKLNPAAGEPPEPAVAGPRWRPNMEDIRIPITAEWQGLQLTARQVTELKVGDVLEIPPEFTSEIHLRLANLQKFDGRLGTVDGRWAVEVTRILRT